MRYYRTKVFKSLDRIPAAAALVMRTLCGVRTNGTSDGSGKVAVASMEYKNSPIVSFRKMIEHWRSPMLKGRKWISMLAEPCASRYRLATGL